ncbi:MAG: acyl-CoA dehydrogenase family protein [Pseudomonadota bacterium]
MDLNLSSDERAFQEDVRSFLDESLPQRLRDGAAASPAVFAEPDIAMEWQQILHEKGWLVYHWPSEYGGTNWSPVQKYIFERECALAGAPAIPVLGVKLLGPVLCAFGTDQQKKDLLPRILSGDDYWCQGFSEPGAGSDLASLKTKAELDGNKYIVNGSKIWTTHAHHATHIFALVRTNPHVKPQEGISFLLIDLDQPGITVRPIVGIAGDHEVNEVFFDNAEAPVTNLVGEEGQGWTIAKFLLENERGGSCLAPKLLADIDRLYQRAAKEPGGNGQPLIEDPALCVRLAALKLEAQALEITELRILSDLAKGRRPGAKTSILKMTASNIRQAVESASMTISGYFGLNLETQRPLYGNDRPPVLSDKDAQMAAPNYLNSRAWTIFGGTNEVQRTIIAKTVLGL